MFVFDQGAENPFPLHRNSQKNPANPSYLLQCRQAASLVGSGKPPPRETALVIRSKRALIKVTKKQRDGSAFMGPKGGVWAWTHTAGGRRGRAWCADKTAGVCSCEENSLATISADETHSCSCQAQKAHTMQKRTPLTIPCNTPCCADASAPALRWEAKMGGRAPPSSAAIQTERAVSGERRRMSRAPRLCSQCWWAKPNGRRSHTQAHRVQQSDPTRPKVRGQQIDT
jgi:hypothetical protein